MLTSTYFVHVRRLLLAMAMVIACASPYSSPAQAFSNQNRLIDAADCVVHFGPECNHVLDAADWAGRVTENTFPGPAHNNMGDAFRHCVWIGALTTRLGQNKAYRMGYIHEMNDPTQPREEEQMDDWNNFIGSQIGEKAMKSKKKDKWGYVLKACESKARNFELYGLSGVVGNYEG